MKLFTLTENAATETISRDGYTATYLMNLERGGRTPNTSLITVYVDVDVIDYDKVTTDMKNTINNILQDMYSVAITKYPDSGNGYIHIKSLKLLHKPQDGGYSVLVGNMNDILSLTRQLLINTEEPEEDLQEIVSSVKEIKYPSFSECMTKIKKAKMVTKLTVIKLDVASYEVLLEWVPSFNDYTIIVDLKFNSLPEDIEDPDVLGLKLTIPLKTFGIRPMINGTTYGSEPLRS